MVLAAQDEAGQGRGPLALDLNPRAINAVAAFGDFAKRLIEQSMSLQPPELLDLVLDRSGYLRMLHDDEEHGDERMENVRELRGAAEQFTETTHAADPRAALAAFLENIALVSDVDDLDRPARSQSASQDEAPFLTPSPFEGEGRGEGSTPPEPITLITLHQAKGLEFDAVFIAGMEEGLLPHSRSLESEADLQEERRICYVGMTRARKRLYLMRAFQRSFRGSRMASVPSRFLAEIPPSLLSMRSIRNAGRRGDIIPDPASARRAAATPAPRVVSGPKPEFSPGDRVRHAMFGDGVIVSARPVRDDTEVTVAFAGKGVKKLLLAFAPLEKAGVGNAGITPTSRVEESGDTSQDMP
jgi:DNA helicase-2/ATP-dependent DNA helicase PcrA